MLFEIIIVVTLFIIFLLNIFADKTMNNKLIDLTKPLLVPLIVVFYCIAADQINWLIVAALFFGFLGDVLLLGPEEPFLKFGLGSFLIGHILYSAAFIGSTHYLKNVPGWFYLFIIPYAVYGVTVMRCLWDKLGKMKIPTIVYMLALFTMSFTSLCVIRNGITLSFILPFTGSLFFIASDSCLAYQEFMKPPKNYETFIMITYIIAQSLIMLGFL